MSGLKKSTAAVLRLLYAFRGRVGRAAYAMFYAGAFVAQRLYFHLHAGTALEDMLRTPGTVALVVFGWMVSLCAASAVTRRLHDFNARGYWGLACLALTLGLRAPFLLYFFCLALAFVPGDRDRNRFGPPPWTLARGRLDRRLAALDRAFAEGRMTAAEFNRQRAELLTAPRPAASSS